MTTLADFEVRLSGGAAVTDPALALGGAMSTVGGGRVLSLTFTAPTTITGVTIDDAMGMPEGDGSLFYDQSAGTLRWTPPAGTAGTPVDVSVNGEYAIQGGNDGGVLLVTVTAGSLPSSDATNSITISNTANNIFGDVSKADASAGTVQYRGLYFSNENGAAGDIVDGRFWVENNTPGQDVIQIADGDEAKTLALEIIADEDTAPAGPVFGNHTDFASGIVLPTPLIGNPTNHYKGWWLQRTVPAGVSTAVPENTLRIGFRVFV